MEPFIGQIIETAYHWEMRDWALCDGRLLPIMQYQALYSLLGTYYGGDGRTNFAIPDFRPRDANGNVLPWEDNKPMKQIALQGYYPTRP
jgi:microcystin-dependent protein